MSLSWRREGYGRWTEPETWVLCGPPLGRAIYAKVVKNGEGYSWFAHKSGGGPGFSLKEARSHAMRHVEQHHPPPLN